MTLADDDDEDADLISQGWIVTEADGDDDDESVPAQEAVLGLSNSHSFPGGSPGDRWRPISYLQSLIREKQVVTIDLIIFIVWGICIPRPRLIRNPDSPIPALLPWRF